MEYIDCYQRNIGLFTVEQQEKLRNSKVVIAGVGGVGGIEAATLAKMGVGEIVIFDPGIFDPPDMNRQFAAFKSNIGRNKAVATAELLSEINPFIKLTVLDYAPTDEKQMDELMQGAALVIDAIDYMGFDYKVFFAQSARRMGKLNFTAPISGLGTTLIIFDPDGMTLEEFYSAPDDPELWKTFLLRLDKLLGPDRFGGLILDVVEGRRKYFSNCAGIANLNGGFVGSEAAMFITGLRSKEELVCAPKAVYIDLLRRVFEIFNPYEESKK